MCFAKVPMTFLQFFLLSIISTQIIYSQMFLLFLYLILPLISTWDLEPKLDCWEECFYEGNIYDKKVQKVG